MGVGHKASLRPVSAARPLAGEGGSTRSCSGGRLGRLSSWVGNGERLVFLGLVLISLVPIWAFTYFPSQDGPVHLENANIIVQHYSDIRGILPDYYEVDLNILGQWLWDSVLAGLVAIFPPLTAEKLFLSGYVILFMVAIRSALQTINRDSGFLALLALPFIYSFPFHMGFYNFCYSLPLFFLLLAYWLKHRGQVSWRRAAILGLLSLLLFLSHKVTFVMAWAGITGLILCDTVAKVAGQGPACSSRRMILQANLIPMLLVYFLVAILLALFLYQQGIRIVFHKSIMSRIENFFIPSSLISFAKIEKRFALGVMLAFAGICSYILIMKRFRVRLPTDEFLFVGFFYFLAYLIAPDHISGGTYVNQRMNLYPVFALILWFGAQAFEKLFKRAIIILVTVITLVVSFHYMGKYAELNSYLEDYLSGMHMIESNTTLLPLLFSHRGRSPDDKILSKKVKPFFHASGYIAAQKDIVDLSHTPIDPLLWRQDLNPRVHIGDIQGEPPQVHFITYHERTGGRVDYVLLWGDPGPFSEVEAIRSIFRQLEEGYELVFTSPRTGLMRLFRRKSWEMEANQHRLETHSSGVIEAPLSFQ